MKAAFIEETVAKNPIFREVTTRSGKNVCHFF